MGLVVGMILSPSFTFFQLSTHFLSPLLTVGEHSEGARLGSEVSKNKGKTNRVCPRVWAVLCDFTGLHLCRCVVVLLLGYCSGSVGWWETGQARKSLFDQLWKVCTVARDFTLRELLLEDCCCWWLTDVDYVKNQGECDCYEHVGDEDNSSSIGCYYSTCAAFLPSSLYAEELCNRPVRP